MDPYQSVAVVNRRSVKWEGMFNGVSLVFQPGETKHYPPNVAIALVADSVLRTNLASGVKEVFALGIVGDTAYPTTPLEGAIASKNPIEQMDRRDVPRLTETEPKGLGEGGAIDLGLGKNEKTTTPLPGAPEIPIQESAIEGEGPIGGSAPGGGLPMASADEVKSLSFQNAEVKRGPQNKGAAEHRISNKPQ